MDLTCSLLLLLIVYNGSSALPTGSPALPKGSPALPTGSSALPTGSSALTTGSSALPTGSSALPSGSWDISFPSAEAVLKRSSGRPITIAVEGNVGSGKSTMLNFFKDYPDIALYPEPVDIWTDLNGTDFLDLVYHNQSRWGMFFESLVQQTMVETHAARPRNQNNQSIPLKLMERSVHSARYCFVESLTPFMEPVEVQILDYWYTHLVERPEFDLDVDLIVYLRTTPEVVFNRMRSRARKEESGIPLSYLQGLHNLYEDWLINKTNPEQYLPPVIVIDATADISILNQVYRSFAKAVWKAIPKKLKTTLR